MWVRASDDPRQRPTFIVSPRRRRHNIYLNLRLKRIVKHFFFFFFKETYKIDCL